MSWGEIVIILLVAIFVLDTKDIVFLVKKFNSLKGKLQEIQSDFYNNIKNPLINNVNLENKLELKNQMLKEIIEREGKYTGDYSLTNVELHYNKMLKNDNKSEM